MIRTDQRNIAGIIGLCVSAAQFAVAGIVFCIGADAPSDVVMYKYLLVLLLFFSLMLPRVVGSALVSPYYLFMASFTIFLVGRVLLDLIGGPDFSQNTYYVYHRYNYHIQAQILKVLSLCICSLSLGYFAYLVTCPDSRAVLLDSPQQQQSTRKAIGLSLFYFGSIGEIFKIGIMLQKTLTEGYTSLYLDGIEVPFWARILSFLFKLGMLLYLSANPAFRQAAKHILLFVLLSLGYLIIGKRGFFVKNLFVPLVYVFYQKHHIKLRWLVLGFAAGVMLLQLSFVARERDSASNAFFSSFIHQQGVTLQVLGLSLENKNYLSHYNVLFDPLTISVRNNFVLAEIIPVRGNPRPLDEVLPMRVNPTAYNAGFGLGSSYVAETIIAGGVPLTIAVNLVIGFLLGIISESRSKQRNRLFLCLAVVPYFMWLPRGNLLNLSEIANYLFFYVFLRVFPHNGGVRRFSQRI